MLGWARTSALVWARIYGRYYLARPGTLHEPQHSTLLEQVLGHHEALDVEGKLRRRSVQVCAQASQGCSSVATV